GDSVTVASASLSDGGFVVIHDSTLVSDGATFDSIRGHSDYLDAGSHSNIEVSLDEPLTSDATVYAMPHLDTNGNQQDDFVSSNGSEDGPYTMNGSAVTDSADVTIQTATATPTATATATATATPTATATATEPPSTATPTTTQPGFGVIVSVLALLGAALIALRRRD
ncbi:MAG: PGF-CTERM sorting domain-containing protein, partial [Haloarculaceae archaeon]